jgi:hypothetical protein
MAVPWLQIVQLVPSILDVSRELLKKTKTPAPGIAPGPPQTTDELAARVVALVENERRQAELVSQMAEQIAALTRALTALHRQFVWLTVGLGIAVIVALVALGLALR